MAPSRMSSWLGTTAVALVLAGGLAAPGVATAQQARVMRAFVAEDYYRLKSVGAPRISLDGRRFVMLRPTAGARADDVQLIVVENFFEELKRLVPK